MFKHHQNTKPPIQRLHPESSLRARVPSVEQPRHAIAAIHMQPEIAVEIHTAGTDKLWTIPVHKAAVNDRLIRGLSPEDALTVGIWYGQAQNRNLHREMAKIRPEVTAPGKAVSHA